MNSAIFLAFFLCVISSVNAHIFLSNLFLNGAKNKECVRKHPATQYDYPLSDKVTRRFSSTPDLICGWPPALSSASDSKCPIAAGSSFQLQWWHANENDDVIDSSHKGPCSVYLAKSDNGQGSVWFKIYEEGYNTATKEWCTDRVRKDGPNKGRIDITIPASLAAGNYLLRSEFWALHEGYTEFGAQPYVGCAEITVSGNGNGLPPSSLINFEGYYKPTDPGLFFNIYNQDASTYVIPGGRVLPLSSGNGGGSIPQNPTTKPTTPTTAPTTPAPGTTLAPTSAPGNCPRQTVCEVGAVGCACSVKGLCDRNLKCYQPKTDANPGGANLCLPLECETGSEKCICTQGGACDKGLTCYSNTCVNVTKSVAGDALKDSSASSVSLTSFFVALSAVVALVL